MLQVSGQEIDNRLREENPWWVAGASIDRDYAEFPRRAYLPPFAQLVRQAEPQRAVLLLGPRRVGKTIMVFHAIDALLREGVFSEAVRRNPRRYIKNDIIDKVLLRDLPSLYGIADVQELNSLFNTVAYNSAEEISLEGLAQSSGVSKPTLAKYLDYLEAAFLIKRIRRVDENAARFRKAMTFKVYLTNSTMRAALFAPLTANHPAIGHLVETAVFSQWLHNDSYIESLHYARWKKGEVDLVSLDARQKPRFAVEVKWSDRPWDDPREVKGLVEFARLHKLGRMPLVTTRTARGVKTVDGVDVEFAPTSVHCYTVGRNTLERSR